MESNITEVEFLKRLSLPRDLNSRPIADFRPGNRGRSDELEGRDRPGMNEDTQNHRTAEMSAEAALDGLSRTLLDEIGTLVQGLTYGEMIELSEAMWKFRAEGSGVTQETLPELLHRWSKSRSATAHGASKELPREEVGVVSPKRSQSGAQQRSVSTAICHHISGHTGGLWWHGDS